MKNCGKEPEEAGGELKFPFNGKRIGKIDGTLEGKLKDAVKHGKERIVQGKIDENRHCRHKYA